MDIIKLGIKDTKECLLNKEFSAVECVNAYAAEISDKVRLNAYKTLLIEMAIDNAKIADEKIKNGSHRALEGIPIAVKDLFCTKNILTTAGSRMLSDFVPQYESTITDRLINQHGMIMIGKTQMDEFAMGSTGTNSGFGYSINPWSKEKDLIPGGSSSGSAVSVAANMSAAALGSDTGGSVRQPASLCGIVGMRPSYGRCSRFGMIPFSSSLDQAGFFTKNVVDSAILLEFCGGVDYRDSTTVNKPIEKFSDSVGHSIKGMKIGLMIEDFVGKVDEYVENLIHTGAKWLIDAGAEIIPISSKTVDYALAAYYCIATAEASSNLAKYDGVKFGNRKESGNLEEMYINTRGEFFGTEAKRRIMLGTYVLSADDSKKFYKKAQIARLKIVEEFNNFFEKVDAIMLPSAISGACPVNELSSDPVEIYLNDVCTVPIALAGTPSISIPCGYDRNGLPLGLQIVAPMFREDILFKVAGVMEKSANFKYL